MGRHSENSSNFIYLEFACFKKLRLFGTDADWRIFHAFLKHSYFVCVAGAAEGGLPAFTHTLRVFNCTGVFQHTAGSSTVGEKLRTVFLTSDRHADSVLCHCNWTVSYQTIKSKPRNVKHL